MNLQKKQVFLEKLAKVEEEVQSDMALALIVGKLKDDELQLLQLLPAFETPVPIEGIGKLAMPITDDPESLLNMLLAVSLVEKHFDNQWHACHYQISPLVSEWMNKQGVAPPDLQSRQTAASYQYYLFNNERMTLTQVIVVHSALQYAEEKDQADRFALKFIIGRLSRFGRYRTLLNDWLPKICQSSEKKILADALG